MKILKAFKTELKPNDGQLTILKKSAGAARWAWNWALRKKIEAFDKKEKIPTAIDLHKDLNVLKKTEIPWMYESSKCAPHEALRNLDKAFNNFFRNCKKKKKGKKGFPRFKSKHKNRDSFRLNGSIHVFADSIQLPRIGMIRLKERDYIPTENAKILSATVSCRAGRWFVSVQCDCGLEIDRDLNAAINLANTARLAGIQAYGDGSAGMFDVEHTKLPSVN